MDRTLNQVQEVVSVLTATHHKHLRNGQKTSKL